MGKRQRKHVARLALDTHRSSYDATNAWVVDHLIYRVGEGHSRISGLGAPDWMGTRGYHERWKRIWLDLAKTRHVRFP